MDAEYLIQVVEVEHSEDSARAVFDGLRAQVGFRFGRILAPSGSKPGWRVQAFFDSDGQREGWLPDGMRRVIVLPSQRMAMGADTALPSAR